MQLEEKQARTAHVFDVVAEGYDREVLRFFPFSAAARLIALEGRVQGIDDL